MGVFAGPDVSENGLVLALDAGNTKSYPGSGTTWTDLSGLRNNANFGPSTAAPTYNSGNGGSIVFDGTNDYISCPATSHTQFNADFTVESWIWIDSTVVSSRPDNLKSVTLFSSNGSSVGTFGLFVSGTTSTAGTGLEIYQDNVSLSAIVSQSVPLNTWVHLAFVRAGSTLYGFINRTQYTFTVLSGSSTALLGNSTSGSRIGVIQNSLYYGYWKGYISNFRVYKGRALTASEISQNYNATKGRYGL
jgi:hypothetical protein